MALTLTEAAKLSNDVLLEGVLDSIIYENALWEFLPFMEVVGTGITYNKENARPTIDHYNVGDTWAESTPTFTQVTAVLKIAGGDCDVDNFLRLGYSNVQDLKTAILRLKVKALLDEVTEQMIYGDSTAPSKEPDGLRKHIGYDAAGAQVIAAGATGATLTLAMVDELCDLTKGGPPQLLLMSKRSRRKIKALSRAAGSNLTVGQGKLGQPVEFWGTIPIGINDRILDTHTLVGSAETSVTGASSSTIYALRFGLDAFSGLMAPGGIMLEDLGPKETKDADGHRVKLYYNFALFNAISCAALIGVTD